MSNPPFVLAVMPTTAKRIGPRHSARARYSAAAAISARRLWAPTASSGVPKASLVRVFTSTITSSFARRQIKSSSPRRARKPAPTTSKPRERRKSAAAFSPALPSSRGPAEKGLDGAATPWRPIFGLSFCAARSRIHGCARCAARRFARISATRIAGSLAEAFRPGL